MNTTDNVFSIKDLENISGIKRTPSAFGKSDTTS